MCAIGKYDTTRLNSTSTPVIVRTKQSTVHTMLAWSSITPFGGPVVPDV